MMAKHRKNSREDWSEGVKDGVCELIIGVKKQKGKTSSGLIGENPLVGWTSFEVRGLIDFYFRGKFLCFGAQVGNAATVFAIDNYHAHASAKAGEGLTEYAQVGIFHTRRFQTAIAGRFLRRDRRKNNV